MTKTNYRIFYINDGSLCPSTFEGINKPFDSQKDAEKAIDEYIEKNKRFFEASPNLCKEFIIIHSRTFDPVKPRTIQDVWREQEEHLNNMSPAEKIAYVFDRMQ